MSNKKKSVIEKASPHTIKKFELIEEYIKSWAQKLMLNYSCKGLIFIDCMCNCGVYTNDAGEIIKGTAVRVSDALLDVARAYPDKSVQIYLNDKDEKKVDELGKHLPQDEGNFKIVTSRQDANELLKTIGPQLYQTGYLHYFLLYDPYKASIDWDALQPFFRNWGEVVINHMVYDPMRAISSAKKRTTIEKYENTYLQEFEKLVPFGSNREAYEARVAEIINARKGTRRYYVSAFPFYNTQNALMYDLIHCTSNREGFKLYKECAWKVFGAKSSTKKSKESKQMVLDLDGLNTIGTDDSCYHISDIARYIQLSFQGRKEVPLREIWALLDDHPIFPSDGYRNEIKRELTETHDAKIEQVINKETNQRETIVTFSS